MGLGVVMVGIGQQVVLVECVVVEQVQQCSSIEGVFLYCMQGFIDQFWMVDQYYVVVGVQVCVYVCWYVVGVV